MAEPSSPSPFSHEQVVFCHDPATGLRAIIGIYSTALGPALGGTRFYPYESEEAALADVLRLSRGMAYKNAVAGLDLGGGKAVIIGDPATDKSEALLRAYGRFVESLGGRYFTACDVGTYVADMDIVARETRYVTGRSEANGGAGDSSVLTAYGVFQGMRAAPSTCGAPRPWPAQGRHRRGRQGRAAARRAPDRGRRPRRGDRRHEQAVEAVRATYPQVDVVADAQALITGDIDVYAPARSAAPSTTTPSRHCGPPSSAAGPTTNWPTRGAAPPSGSRSAASRTRPTSWSTPAA